MKSNDELSAALAAALVSLSHTQGALIRVMANLQDMQAGRPVEESMPEILSEWEAASRSLMEGARLLFDEDAIPDAVKAVAFDDQ